MKYCSNCGAELEDNAKFCGECGTKQPEPTKYCSNCGVELTPNAKFCMECGTPVGDIVSNLNNSINTETISSQPIQSSDGNISVTQTDGNTISIVLKGIPFNLKLVKGKNYGTDKEINDFYIGETPVTQALYMTVTGNNPSEDNEDLNYPVTNITPALANSFLVKLQKETGVKFELPTKEQWNFAYKGGNESKGFYYSGSNDINEVGWIDNLLHPVGELYPNELGIHDMEGNVSELLKGNGLTPLSSDSPKDETNDNLKGFRVVFNYNTNGKIDGNSILQKVLATQLPKLKMDWEKGIKKAEEDKRKNEAYKEELKSIKDKSVKDRILSYKRKNGIIVYDNWKEIEENLGFLVPDLQDTTKAENFKKDKFSIDYKKLKWKTFGELALDEDEYELAEDFEEYEGDVEYTIINGDILIIKGEGDELPEFADEEWISENEDSNYYKLNTEIEQQINEIKTIIILNDVTYTGTHCFEKFKNLKYLFLADSIYSIDTDDGINNCNKLEKVFISSHTILDNEVFAGCPMLISSDDIDKNILRKANEYKKQRGLIRYSDYDEIQEVFPYLDKIAYEKNQEVEEKINNIVEKHLTSDKLVWKTFGELAFEESKGHKQPKDGYKGQIQYTIINKKILVLRGNGVMPNFFRWAYEQNDNTNYWELNEELKKHSSEITSMVIMDGIEKIGRYCCGEFHKLNNIILPKTLLEISSRAFEARMIGLPIKYIKLPDGLERINNEAFAKCWNITALLSPPSVDRIEDYAFSDCRKLKYLFVSKRTDVYEDALKTKED